MAIIPPINEARRRTALDKRTASRGPRARDERRPVPIMGTECASRLADWLTVTDQTTWGSAGPFDLVDGGKEGLTKALCDVTSDVKEFPADGAAYGSYLVGRLMAYADVSAASIAHLAVFVEERSRICMYRDVCRSLYEVRTS